MSLRYRWFEALVKASMAGACLWVLNTAHGLSPDKRGIGTHEQLGMAPCGYRITHGQPCITCGMTTSFTHFAHGDVFGAFLASPAGALLFILTAVTPFWLAHSYMTAKPALRILQGGRGPRILFLAIVILLASWAYKIRVDVAG